MSNEDWKSAQFPYSAVQGLLIIELIDQVYSVKLWVMVDTKEIWINNVWYLGPVGWEDGAI